MLPVTGLQRVHRDQRALKVSLDHQSREEEAINGTNQDIQFQPAFPRYPLVLFLDSVVSSFNPGSTDCSIPLPEARLITPNQLDPGNMGAIIRSAFSFGVDAIAISKRATAPITAVTLKASAGAAESMPLLSVDKPEDFVSESSLNGWKVYAAMIPSKLDAWKRGSFTNHSLGSPTLDHPCVLMIGGEGEGLARALQKKANFAVSVEGARMGQGGVDSLNVSVATAILCDAFLRKQQVRPRSERHQSEQAGIEEAAKRGDSTRSDHTRHVDANEEEPELDSNVIPGPSTGEEVPQTHHVEFDEEEREAAVDGLEAIDETKAHHYLEEESVSAPKNRLF